MKNQGGVLRAGYLLAVVASLSGAGRAVACFENEGALRMASTDEELENYSYSLRQDVDLSLIQFLAPEVPVSATHGHFRRFDDIQHFKRYHNTKRAIGGNRTRIEYGDSPENYDASAHGLEIAIDDQERDAVGNSPRAQMALEQGKLRALTTSAYLGETQDVIQVALDSVAATGGVGNWSNDANDPIDEINGLIVAMADDIGMMPNKILFSVGSLAIFAKNAKVKERQKSGIVTADFSAFKVGLLNPGIEHKVASWVVDAAKRGGTASKRANILGADVFLFFSQDTTTQYDPSFMKTFRGGMHSITGVSNYRDDRSNSDILVVDWSRQAKVTSPLCVRRITVS